MLLTGLYSTHLFAKCAQKEKTLFFCEIQDNGKILEVCDQGKTLSYSFGKKDEKKDLSIIVPRGDASTYQWGGIGSSESYSVTIPNGDTKYTVFWAVEKAVKGFPETSGVIVKVKGKEVATINCVNKAVIHNLIDVDLKPDEGEIETVKGPVFSVEVALSQKAKEKMEELHEKIIISSTFSATRAIPLKQSIDSEDPTIITLNEFEVEIGLNETAHFKSISFPKTTFDKIKKSSLGERNYELVLNAYSARKSHKNNLIVCSTLLDDLPDLLNHKHIRLWCALIDEPSGTPQGAEVQGTEKAKYDQILQNCFDQYGVMNNTVLASCKEEVSSAFKGTEREYLQAPKLEGLVDITGSYERQDDRWDFSLDESEGFHLIHTKKDKRDEVLIADGLELIEGHRYSLYVENKYGDTDPKWALIFNPKTNHYDLEVKTYDKASHSWKSLLFSKN